LAPPKEAGITDKAPGDNMKISLKMHSGKPASPIIILIHGLGMNNYFWVDPERCFVLGGLAPLTIFLADATAKPENTVSFGTMKHDLQGLWHQLQKAGFSLASWTQSKPLGPIQVAIDELGIVIATVRDKWPHQPIYLVGHSRGGLIARKFLLEEKFPEIKGLITICSPHSGTGMAKFVRYLKPTGAFLEKIIPHKSKAGLAKALARLAEFLQSPAIDELTPRSAFLSSLKKPLPNQIRKLSFGGTSPALFQIVLRLPARNYKVIKFPDMLVGAIPSVHLPHELTPGIGDALVTAESAKLPGSIHYNFPNNHVRSAYDKEVQKIILTFLS
jgi:pimeloyl-ACP methyl ester carboxylesterase